MDTQHRCASGAGNRDVICSQSAAVHTTSKDTTKVIFARTTKVIKFVEDVKVSVCFICSWFGGYFIYIP